MNRRTLPFFSGLSWAWFFLILVLATYDIKSLFFEKTVQFDLMALLPESKTESMKATNQLMDETNLSGRVLILVGHQNSSIALSALNELRSEIARSSLPLSEQKSESLIQEYKNFFKTLYPYRAGFLSAKDRDLLINDNGSLITKRALAQIMLPISSLGPVQIKSDPFFLYPQYVSSIQSPTLFQRDGNGETFFNKDGKTWFLFNAMLNDSAFSVKTQKDISEKLFPILDGLQEGKGIEVLKTGAVFYAAEGSKQANAEVSLIGFASILGIVLLLLFIFKSFRPLIFAIAVISSGLMAGLASCLMIYGNVHILALVFGSSLVGVTVDYSLHYYCASYSKLPSHRLSVLNSLMPALFLSVLSTVIGYSLLMISPFPGIQQMAVLASVGLLSSFLSVCLWGPYLVKGSEEKTPLIAVRLQNLLTKFANYGNIRNVKLYLSIGSIVLFVIGTYKLTFDDDVRRFQSLDAPLKKEEERIRSMINLESGSKFILIQKQNLEDVLQLEEKIQFELDALQRNNEISNYRTLTMLTPSKMMQENNRQLVEVKLYKKEGTHLSQILRIKNDFNTTHVGLDAPFFSINQDNINLLPEGWKDLIRFSEDGKVIGRIFLHGAITSESLENLAMKYRGVHFIDPPREYSKLFATYRQIMIGVLLALISGISISLLIWKGLKQSLIILSPVVLSVLATIGIIGLCSASYNLFHAMGMLLVLCIGIDYAFFLYWRKTSEDSKDLLLLANGLASITTILSFGLLSFSKTTAIHSFGLVVFSGIVLNFCVTTLFLGKRKI